jgi:hypothetical protein
VVTAANAAAMPTQVIDSFKIKQQPIYMIEINANGH